MNKFIFYKGANGTYSVVLRNGHVYLGDVWKAGFLFEGKWRKTGANVLCWTRQSAAERLLLEFVGK